MDTLSLELKTYLTELIHAIRIADIFDIAIIVILTYVILLWFKKTTSRFVLIGIIILGVIYGMARFFNMYLTEYVFQGFFAILLVALVIIFQEDLRRFFEQLAMWGVFKKKMGSDTPQQDMDILTHAAAQLAKRKEGALIVLKGTEYLDRHIEGGIELDGILSEALLESIFDPHSIGHDGAVIIDDGRVTRFGCHLPLSINSKKIGHIGLRHTAALGLSELSDALCIVVSEERGTISIARGGKLRRIHSVDQLRTILDQDYPGKSQQSTKKTWFGRIRENPLEKGIALILACGLWLAFAYQTENVRRDFAVPIEYRNLPNHWVIDEPKPSEASVTLAGSSQAFNLFNPETLKVVLDMSELKEGKQSYTINRNLIRYPSNLSVVGIQPDKIRLIAHKMIPIEAPVNIETTGTPPEGFLVRKISLNPQKVTVMALPKHKSRLKVTTEQINLSAMNVTSTLKPKLVFPTNVQFVNGKSPEVQVTIEIERKQIPSEKAPKSKN